MTTASQIIPQGEIRQLMFGGSDPAVLERIFGELPAGEPYKDNDRRRAQTIVMLGELHEIYYRTAIFDHRLFEGYREGMQQFRRLVAHYPFDEALAKVETLMNDQLSVVQHIEAVFFTHSDLDTANSAIRKRVCQLGRPVSEGEAFVFGIREGMRYVVAKARALASEAPTEVPSAYMDVPPVWRVLAYHDEQRQFVERVLPKLRDKYADRPCSAISDIRTHGYGRVADLILRVSLHIRGKRPYSRENFDDEYNGKYRRILENPLLQRMYIEQVRVDGFHFHLLRLGFGHALNRPSKDNKIFDRSTPADQVPVSDLEEVFNHHQNLKGDCTNWWVQEGVEGAVKPEACRAPKSRD